MHASILPDSRMSMKNRDVWWETGLLQNFDMEVIIPDHIGEAVELSEQCKDFLEHLLQVIPHDLVRIQLLLFLCVCNGSSAGCVGSRSQS